MTTSPYNSLFLNEMHSRGFVHQGTHLGQLDEALCHKTIVAYVGFDVTAPSLHVGNLLMLMMMRWLKNTGHRPLILVGGGTTKIGDPSGKDQARNLLSHEVIQNNLEKIKSFILRFLHDMPTGPSHACRPPHVNEHKKPSQQNTDQNNPGNNTPGDVLIVNNAEWLDSMKYIDFLREFGALVSVNKMLTLESIQSRLARQQHLSVLEFNYPLLQAYDFYHLFCRYGCSLQVGGADQWGNIVMGVDLVRRLKNKTVYGLTVPLLTTATGEKMGKTAKGAVWLDGSLCSPYHYWQFWRNVHDSDVVSFLKLFTFLPLERIQEGASNVFSNGHTINALKTLLADEATFIVHGPQGLAQAHASRDHFFAQPVSGGFEGAKEGISNGELSSLESSLAALPGPASPDPSMEVAWEVTRNDLSTTPLLKALLQTGLISSYGQGRRLFRGGGVRINRVVITSENRYLEEGDFHHNRLMLSVGKKNHALVRLLPT